MGDDAGQLEQELSYTPRRSLFGTRIRERPPAGANAITAFAVLYTGVLWLVTLSALAKAELSKGSSDVVSPGACLTLVVLGVEMLVAGFLAGRTWKAIGPTARAIIRPFMFLGPWPLVIVGAVGFCLLSGLVTGKLDLKNRGRGKELVGENWRAPALDRRSSSGLKWPEVAPRCSAQGPGWKVPTPDEFATLRPTPSAERRAQYWLASPGDASIPHLAWAECDGFGKNCQWKTGPGSIDPNSVAPVICVSP
jgi:hypothetical protein